MGIMHFEHGVPLASISSDGLQLPEIYAYYDAEAKLHGTVANISPVVQINGMDPAYYLQANIAVTIGLQDPDARYNHLFPSPAAAFAGEYTGGAWTNNLGSWSGAANQTIEFANGTRLIVETTASVQVNEEWDFSSGESLFRTACMPQIGNSPTVSAGTPPYAIPLGGPAMYPVPVLRQKQDLIRGYYLPGPGLHDVAVLQVPTFRLNGESPTSFGQTATDFVGKAIRDGKGKLILDLSSNNGGDMNLGFNLFRILFPGRQIYTATRFPATELIDLMGRLFSSSQGLQATGDHTLDLPLIFQNAVTPDHRHSFSSWEDLYGPVEFPGTNMSHLHATFNFTTASTDDNPISGYGGHSSGPLTQPFKAQDIIIMTNGRCASTCTMLAGLLKQQGVRSIVFGGRPRTGPMQALGGNKGGQYWSLATISHYVEKARSIAMTATETGSPILTAEELARFIELAPPSLSEFPLRIDSRGGSGVNFRNEYGEGDARTPLHFVYEAADCRLFFTAENYILPGSLWVAAAEAMFGDAPCVESFQD
ncbi:hypothetical protein BDV28DRAFT_23233 [Aspergillus coremiiformis]|uniref:Uncharacterized protein n=1 Tax=Aspergillus coremiiformis TaxID=138285 RepID=A0A5N6Z0S3_9EURO|nr:hypothetical protein BDV28DRAFT_23233 [Aspergillus coremiiformis]